MILGHPDSVVAKAPKPTAALTGICGALMAAATALVWMANGSWFLLAFPLVATLVAIAVMSMAIVRITTGRMPNTVSPLEGSKK